MEIKKSNHSSNDKWLEVSYKESGIYKNTDETGIVDLFYINKTTLISICLGATPSDFAIFESKPIIIDHPEAEMVSEKFILDLVKILK